MKSGIKCSSVSVRGCKHGFFCNQHFVEHQQAMIGREKEIDSAIYEEVLKLKSLRGQEIRKSNKRETKEVQNSSSCHFSPLTSRSDNLRTHNHSISLFLYLSLCLSLSLNDGYCFLFVPFSATNISSSSSRHCHSHGFRHHGGAEFGRSFCPRTED